MRRTKEGNIIYLVPKQSDSMDLRCSSYGVVKNELDIDSIDNKLVCECGSNSFTIQMDIEELM